MATYLPGVTDSGFNPVLSSPNLPFLMSALQKVTARYEKNYDEMSQGYSSILNADIFNNVKSKERDGYLDKIKDNLKTISTTDLSVQSNIDAANNLYTPFWEDKNMLSHIADTKARKNQLLQQEKIKKEHPDYDNTTPTTVMNYYINKIKTAENPDIINEVPLINAVGLKNNPKEFQEWLKKNEWKQETSVSQDGRIYKQINGNDSSKSYSELYRMYLGNSAEDQYNMYGEYFKIQAIQKIKDDKKKYEGLDISDNDAIKLIPKFYVNEQLENYNSKKKSLLSEINAVGDNIKKFSKDVLKQKLFNEQLILLDDAYKNITKEENILKTQGGDNEDDKKTYNDLILKITDYPTSFFANVALNKDTETAARMAASNQSLTISTDEAALAVAKLQQDAAQFLETNTLEWAKLQAKVDDNANNTSTSTTKGKGTTVVTDENGVVLENVIPSVTNAQSNNNIASVVTRFQKLVSEYNNEGISTIVNLLQSTNSNVFSGIITPQETAVLAAAYQQNNYTPEYATIREKTKKALIQNGASEKEINKIKGPVGLLLALGDRYASEIQKKINQKEINLKNGKPDKVLDAELTNDYGEFTILQKAREQLNNAYTYKKEFDESINLRIQKDPKRYEKISILNKDNRPELVTAENLSIKYPSINEKGEKTTIPVSLMQMYLNNTIQAIPDVEKIDKKYQEWVEEDNNAFLNLFGLGDKKSDKEKVLKNYKKPYVIIDPETNKKYDVTELYNKFGSPRELNERLSKTILSDKALVPAGLTKKLQERTGEMGRTITWTSSIKSEADYADKLANTIGQNLDLYVIQKDDKYNVITADPKLAETLNSGVISQIKSTPIKGLTSVKYNPIGSIDPSKRNITLVYDQEVLLGANAKDDKYKNWDGSITFELKSDAEIPGLPKASSGSYYDFILSNNPKGIKQQEIDEKFGLRFQFYKDQNNQVQYKAAYQTIVEDKETKVLSYVWKSVDVSKGVSGPYVENGGFSMLPSNMTVEDVIERLRQVMYSSIIPNNNTTIQKHYPSQPPVSITDQQTIDELNKSNTNILNKYK
jgi:hypothetical protein